MIKENLKQTTADLSLLLVTAIWGATFVTVKNALDDVTPFYFNAMRFFLATLLLMIITWHRRKHVSKDLVFSGILIGFFLFAGYSFQTIGLQYTTASNAGFITGLCVVMVPLFSTLLTRQLPPGSVVAGVVLATIGLGLLTLDSSLKVNTGDILVFFCAVAFALHIITVGKYAPVHDTLLLVTIQVGAVAVFSTVFAFLTEPLPSTLTSQVWSALFITAILATALAFFIQNLMQKFTTPVKTAIIFSMEPVFAAIFAYLWLSELMSVQDWWGSAFVLTGMLVAELPWGQIRGERLEVKNEELRMKNVFTRSGQ